MFHENAVFFAMQVDPAVFYAVDIKVYRFFLFSMGTLDAKLLICGDFKGQIIWAEKYIMIAVFCSGCVFQTGGVDTEGL